MFANIGICGRLSHISRIALVCLIAWNTSLAHAQVISMVRPYEPAVVEIEGKGLWLINPSSPNSAKSKLLDSGRARIPGYSLLSKSEWPELHRAVNSSDLPEGDFSGIEQLYGNRIAGGVGLDYLSGKEVLITNSGRDWSIQNATEPKRETRDFAVGLGWNDTDQIHVNSPSDIAELKLRIVISGVADFTMPWKVLQQLDGRKYTGLFSVCTVLRANNGKSDFREEKKRIWYFKQLECLGMDLKDVLIAESEDCFEINYGLFCRGTTKFTFGDRAYLEIDDLKDPLQ